MAKTDFSKPLSSIDLIELFPQIIEALGLPEPEETFQYLVLEPELFAPDREEELVKTMGYASWINLADAQADLADAQKDLAKAQAILEVMIADKKDKFIEAAKDDVRAEEKNLYECEEDVLTATKQQAKIRNLKNHGFEFYVRPLEDGHYKRDALRHDKENLVYIVRQPDPRKFEEDLAAVAGLSPDDICLKYEPNVPNIETQLANILMLGRMAEGVSRRIMPDGSLHQEAITTEADAKTCTRAVLAAEQVWRKQYGSMDVFIAYRSAHLMASLTKMQNDRNLDFEYGHLDEALVEKTRQHIAYSLITDLCDFNGKQPDPAHLAAPRELPVQEMIKNATRLLDYVVHEHFDGDVSAHKEAIGMFTRFAEGRATGLDKVAMEVSGLHDRMKDLLTLSMLVKMVDGYDSICADACEAQCRASPIVVVRALHHVNEYYKAAFDNTPPKVDPAAIPSVLGRKPAAPPDRSMQRLRRAKPDGSRLH